MHMTRAPTLVPFCLCLNGKDLLVTKNSSAICPDTSFRRGGGLLKCEVSLNSRAAPVLHKVVIS